MSVRRAINAMEKAFLILLARFTVAAMPQEAALVSRHQQVELKGLRLMFSTRAAPSR